MKPFAPLPQMCGFRPLWEVLPLRNLPMMTVEMNAPPIEGEVTHSADINDAFSHLLYSIDNPPFALDEVAGRCQLIGVSEAIVNGIFSQHTANYAPPQIGRAHV